MQQSTSRPLLHSKETRHEWLRSVSKRSYLQQTKSCRVTSVIQRRWRRQQPERRPVPGSAAFPESRGPHGFCLAFCSLLRWRAAEPSTTPGCRVHKTAPASSRRHHYGSGLTPDWNTWQTKIHFIATTNKLISQHSIHTSHAGADPGMGRLGDCPIDQKGASHGCKTQSASDRGASYHLNLQLLTPLLYENREQAYSFGGNPAGIGLCSLWSTIHLANPGSSTDPVWVGMKKFIKVIDQSVSPLFLCGTISST